MTKYAASTGIATTNDWLRATEGMKVTAYDPAALTNQRNDSATTVFTNRDFEAALEKAPKKTRPEK
jgi:hypothetical protein